MPVLGLTDVLHHKSTVCCSFDILITSIIIAFLGEELIKKTTKIILLITRGAVSLVMCSSGFVSSFFHLVWYSAFIFSCLPLFNHVGLCPKVHPRKFLLKDLELHLRKERVILGKVTYWSKSALLHNFIRLNPCIGPCYI